MSGLSFATNSVLCNVCPLADETKAERQEALSRMMKLSFEVEDSNETTNCSPSPHPENEVNMLEEKSLHALVYNVKRTPVNLDDEEKGESEEVDGIELGKSKVVKEEINELHEQASEDEDVETKEKHEEHGEVGLSIEDLRDQYTALQQQMALLQQQLVNQNQQQQQQVGSPVDNTLQQQQMALFQQQMMLQQQQPSTAADASLHMQHLQQQQLMMQQQIMLQQMHNPQGIPAAMMMQPPGVIMVPVAAAPPMQMTNVGTESVEKNQKDEYCEQTDMATQHTPGSPKIETESREKDTTEVKSDKKSNKNYPFKMLSQGQNKGKSLKYSSYIMSAKREFARKEAQRPRTNSTPPQASVSPSVVETEQRWRANTVDSEAVLQEAEGQKSKVNDESNAYEGSRLPEAVVQPMSHIENEAPEPVDTGITNEAPEHVENEIDEHVENDAHEHTESPIVENSDTDHATITSTSTSALNATNSSAIISSSADVETASLTTISEGTTSSNSNVEETDTNKQASIPQARVAPVVAAKPQSRGPARRISVKTERDHEVEKIGSVGNVSKFRQVGRLLNNKFGTFPIMLFCKFG